MGAGGNWSASSSWSTGGAGESGMVKLWGNICKIMSRLELPDMRKPASTRAVLAEIF